MNKSKAEFNCIMVLLDKGEKMIIVTTDNIAGKSISKTLGIVKGQVVQTKHVGSDIV
jgi:hypothetical protein